MADKQKQKAGNNSQLIQAGVVNFGIDEKRVREIVEEKLTITLGNFTNEAAATAKERNGKFENSLIKKMVQESALEAFSDPSFQILLVEAQKRAASTEREQDYDLLSELMFHRFQKGSNRVARAGISRAVEIIDQISDESLLAITVFHSLTYFSPGPGNISQGLKVLDDLFGKVIYNTLPTNDEWLDHLDILDVVRISSYGGMKLLENFWYEHFDGYLKNGIEEESEKYKEAKKILIKVGLNQNCLVRNTFNEKYFKLPVLNKLTISKLAGFSGRPSITDDEKFALENIYDLYDGNKMSKEDFIKVIEGYPNLKKLREWWNGLSKQNIKITSVGRVLAHSNAQRVDKSLPALD